MYQEAHKKLLCLQSCEVVLNKHRCVLQTKFHIISIIEHTNPYNIMVLYMVYIKL
jgi:hypothetical protein